MNFNQKLLKISRKNDSLLCIGLDIDRERMPSFLFKSESPYLDFNKRIIEATKDIVCAYKLNLAFYEALGKEGFQILEETILSIPKDIIVILDGKRNDIASTMQKYAQLYFDTLKADAATVNPYLGQDGLSPFLRYKDRCTFILCRTSNLSAGELQDLEVSRIPLYQVVCKKIREWNENNNCGAVAGATYPRELKIIRTLLGEDIPLLIPGIGKQKGDVRQTVLNGTNREGEMAIINSSRSIIFAGEDEDFAEVSRKKAILLRDEINKYR